MLWDLKVSEILFQVIAAKYLTVFDCLPFDLALTAHLNGLNMSNVVHELFLYA